MQTFELIFFTVSSLPDYLTNPTDDNNYLVSFQLMVPPTPSPTVSPSRSPSITPSYLSSPTSTPTGSPTISASSASSPTPSPSVSAHAMCNAANENYQMTLSSPNGVFTSVAFASYGTGTTGSCPSYTVGSCFSINSSMIVAQGELIFLSRDSDAAITPCLQLSLLSSSCPVLHSHSLHFLRP